MNENNKKHYITSIKNVDFQTKLADKNINDDSKFTCIYDDKVCIVIKIPSNVVYVLSDF